MTKRIWCVLRGQTSTQFRTVSCAHRSADLQVRVDQARAMLNAQQAEGAAQGAGVPSFKQWLTGEDVEAIRAFVISQSNRRLRK